MGASGRNDQLDGLRGYAAIFVAVFHTILNVDPSLISRVLMRRFSDLDSLYDRATWIVLHAVSGDSAVVVFFVLSGAVLFNSLLRLKGGPSEIAAIFLLRRVLRIYPAMIVCILVAALLLRITSRPVDWHDVVSNSALTSFPIVGPSWTLQVEMLAAPLLLLSFAGFRLGGTWGLLLVGVLISVLLNLPGLPDLPIRNFWPCFVAGMLIPTPAGEAVSRWVPSLLWPLVLVAMLFLSGPTTEKVCGAIIVCKLYYFDCGALGAFLGRQASVYVGRISYSFYLFNVPILGWLTFELQKTPLALSHQLEIGIAASVMVVAATLVVAHLSTNLIELPVATFSSLLGRRQAAVDAKAR